MLNRLRHLIFTIPLLCAACAEQDLSQESDEASAAQLGESAQQLTFIPSDGDYSKAGPHVVGTKRIKITASGRTLPVQLWYPAVESARAESLLGRPIKEFEPTTESVRLELEKIVMGSVTTCTTQVMHAADGVSAFAQTAGFPLIVFSHCLDGARFEMFTAAEHLASMGFVVAAPDHVGGTIYNSELNPTSPTSSFLKTRAADIRGVIDAMLNPSTPGMPTGLAGRIDATRIGAFGHSFGSATTGLVLETDKRVRAGAMLAAGIDMAFVDDAHLDRITQPGLFFEAMEDNSIGLAGNSVLEADYKYYPKPVWGVRVPDGGHWSFTDFAGLNKRMMAGCGSAKRQTIWRLGQAFDYVPNADAKTFTKAYLAAFFNFQLNGDTKGATYLSKATPATLLNVVSHTGYVAR